MINIELNQKQVALISDQLQSKLQQQSFWVKSNAPMDVDWVKQFLPAVQVQVTEIIKQIDFSNWRENLVPAALIIALLLVFTFLIQLQKAKIKQRLTNINQKINTLTSDSQWHTPEAILWTLVLCLPSTFIFTAIASVYGVFVFCRTIEFSKLGCQHGRLLVFLRLYVIAVTSKWDCLSPF